MLKSTISPQTRLKELLLTEKEDIWVIIAYGAFTGLFSLIVPIAVQSLVNTIGFGSMLQPILILTLLVFIILIFSGVMTVLQNVVVEVLQQRIFARISTELAYRLPRVQIKAYDKSDATELVNRFFDVLIVQKSSAILLVDGIAVALQTVLGMLLLAFYHPLLLAFDVLLVLGVYFIFVQLGKNAVPTSIEESKKKYALVAWLEELTKNPLTFRAYGGLDLALRKADDLTVSYVVARKAHYRILLRQIFGATGLQIGANALLLGLGGWLVIQKQLTLGQLVAAELIVAAVANGFAKFGKYLETFYDLTAAADKLGYLFDLPLEEQGSESLPESFSPSAIRFKDVSFGFEGRDDFLKEMNLEIKAGAKIAIIGANGAGKSTLADLAFGLRTPTLGAVEIENVDLREISLEHLRSKIGFVRSVEIFEGSILENIRVNRPEIELLEVRNILSSLGLLDELAGLKDGLNTQLMSNYPNLSEGQAQTLMLARALVGQPKLIILDESLDSIDAETYDKLIKILFNPQASWTLLITSHNPKIIENCDDAYLLFKGKLIQQGKRLK